MRKEAWAEHAALAKAKRMLELDYRDNGSIAKR